MKKNTRFAFNAYLQQLARLNGVAVEELSSKFTVEPSVQQTLEDQIQQSAAFLTLINVTPVTEQSGQLLGLGVGSTIAGTTDTTAKEREPVDPTLMVDVEYKCEQTNFDTVLTYAKLDLCTRSIASAISGSPALRSGLLQQSHAAVLPLRRGLAGGR
ncbi:phage major capsid protein [Escherichia coli]|nr:hypothetical protein A1WU_02578 [Escherichia coli KTE108]KGM59584.1 capsid protein [Escherichia coli G3/10]GCT37960.1 phage major capsid protein [Escherichia coli]DAH46296.1 MAG TPA: major capsid protein [Caudoviricetes sp.]GCU34653.1 phage major capsid protein [Escherichia coli]